MAQEIVCLSQYYQKGRSKLIQDLVRDEKHGLILFRQTREDIFHSKFTVL